MKVQESICEDIFAGGLEFLFLFVDLAFGKERINVERKGHDWISITGILVEHIGGTLRVGILRDHFHMLPAENH